MQYKILQSKLKGLVGSCLQAAVRCDGGLLGLVETGYLLATDDKSSVIDTVLDLPWKPRIQFKDIYKPILTELGTASLTNFLEKIVDYDEEHRIIGFAHNHPKGIKPSEQDLKFTKVLEIGLKKPMYSMILGDTQTYARVMFRARISTPSAFRESRRQPRIRSPPKYKDIAEIGPQSFKIEKVLEFNRAIKKSEEKLLNYLVRKYMKSANENIKMYDSSGKEVRLEIV